MVNKKIIFDKMLLILALFFVILSFSLLLFLVLDIFFKGFSGISFSFLTSFPSRHPEKAGILSSWVGTLWVMFGTATVSIPIGVGAGIYLEEYGRKNIFSNILEINIANLAAVPSIIFGLLGLGIFARTFGLGRSIITGSLTLALLILPMIILTTREALKAVPFSIREASYALGATKWKTIVNQVLPVAFPNILTGIILGISRAIGETAPLITIGALTYIAFLPSMPIKSEFPFLTFKGFMDPFTTLPIQIFNWVSRPQRAFQLKAASAIIVLLFIVFLLNGIAIYLRLKYQKRLKE